MQQVLGKRKRGPASSKPERSKTERTAELCAFLRQPGNEAMVACSNCVRDNKTCFYRRESSVKCAECLERRRPCDGTFSLQELKRVGDQKKEKEAESRKKRKEMAHLRALLAKVEAEDNALQDAIAELEETATRMLRREMQALGAFEGLPDEEEVALADDPGFLWSLDTESDGAFGWQTSSA